MKLINKIFDKRGAPILMAGFVVLFILETRHQLRKQKYLRSQRIVTNTLVSLPAFGLLRFLFLPVVVKIAAKNRQWKCGLNYWLPSHPVLKGLLAFLIMDYTNYLWHILNHKVPMLWRFHLVHHTDRDMDVTTALRFHFGEMIGSVFYRGAFVFLSGATPLNVLVYEVIFESATQFHHSNLKLPLEVEKKLNTLIVTPRMHGIHHSEIREETDSNYSVIFSFWDRLHKTIKLNIPQSELTLGVPGYRNKEELTLKNLLKLPFKKIKKWDVSLLKRNQKDKINVITEQGA